jgi:transcriptional regulator with XRE-family HTH domain
MRRDLGVLFRKRLAQLREAQGLTQPKLAERIGAGPQYIGHLETGRIKTPPWDKLKKLATALNVSVGDFFFVEGIDENADELRAKIYQFAKTKNVKLLRKYYRLMLVAREDWPVNRDEQHGG